MSALSRLPEVQPGSGPAPEARAWPAAARVSRPHVRGRFLFVGDDKLWVKGVTYGTFDPALGGNGYGTPERVHRDFAAMAENGINALRIYTQPPRWLLDVAAEFGLRVLVGLGWEQHVAFLDSPAMVRRIRSRAREQVRALAGHPALLCWSVGNEIPASIVRWHGRRRVERFLHGLARIVREEDPGALVTYVNYPTTEYLELPWLDLVVFNVFLESRSPFESYVARLLNLCGDRPLLLGEFGLDSGRNGEERQAEMVAGQVRGAFEAGACGTFVYSWTDEWWCGGRDIAEWSFGLTRRDRSSKPALARVRGAYAEAPFSKQIAWPHVSVVVCSLNGARTIRDTLEGLMRLDYPSYEVIVVDDGSTDQTAAIAAEYPVRLVRTPNRGLSSARNTGCEAARGEIVAYIDDDAYPDRDWLSYLALDFATTDHVGAGGPNLPPPGDGPIADCVANAPGGPVHVLLADRVAEHIPGCNMAFRRQALLEVGGFDPVYRAAGDDVDLCWRLQERGGVIGFAPAAVVWHHRRNSLRAYWKQQIGYGKAEALLERKWPQKYNATGHLTWAGRLYGKGWTRSLAATRWRIYHGVWGGAPFQSLYEASPGTLLAVPLLPESYLVLGGLVLLSLLGLVWRPLLWAAPAALVLLSSQIAHAVWNARRAAFTTPARGPRLFFLRLQTAVLHLVQPVARLRGRLRHGLTPWRRRGTRRLSPPWPRTRPVWRETWCAPETTLATLLASLHRQGVVAWRGGDYDRWDLAARGGLLGGARLRFAVEEHGSGRQMLRFRIWPHPQRAALAAAALCGVLAGLALAGAAWLAAGILGAAGAGLAAATATDCALGQGAFLAELDMLKAKPSDVA